MTSKIAVIIPVYNGAQFVERAINSVLNQTFQDFRIIVVNDGSTDETKKILRKYETNNKITIYSFSINRGQAFSNNFALRNAHESYIAYLDCDDIMHPSRLEKQYAFLENNSEIGLVYCECNTIDKMGNKKAENRSFNQQIGDGLDFINSLLVLNLIDRSSVMHRKSCTDLVGSFDIRITGSDDWDMWVRISEKFGLKKINEPLVDRYIHGENISLTRPNKIYYHENAILIIKKAYTRRKSPKFMNWLIISKRLRVLLLRMFLDKFGNYRHRIINRIMFMIDWPISLFISSKKNLIN